VPDRGSQRFNVWLLDVAELSAQRATAGMDFLGWEEREKRRNRKLIFTGEEAPASISEAAKKIQRTPKKPAAKRWNAFLGKLAELQISMQFSGPH
jgi:hypothetical protein